MIRIGILSDTHGYLHPRVFDFFAGCDEVWHAGDIGNTAVTERLKTFKPLRAVHGNIDDHVIRSEFKEVELFKVENVRVMITHIAGYPGKLTKSVQQLISVHQPDLLVAGHSHILKVQFDERNRLLFINPGAAGIHGFHDSITLVRLSITDKSFHDLEVFDIARNSLSDSVDRPQ